VNPDVASELANLDYAKLVKKIEHFISSSILNSPAKGLVIGLSGGLDSSVVLKLAVDAIGASRVTGILIPSDVTPREDTDHANELAKSLGIKYLVIDINSLLAKYAELLPDDKRARGNLMARIRMGILYYHANVSGYLVAGTSDRSEVMIGYYTKWGDGAADILPIANLYKTQVRALAKFLNLPPLIVEKKSSPQLWKGHLAEEEIGMDYETIDSILYLLVDRKLRPKEISKKLSIKEEQVVRIKNMIEASKHKRALPASP